MSKILKRLAIVGSAAGLLLAGAVVVTNLTACGGGCDASTFTPACTADNQGITLCLFGLEGHSECNPGTTTGNVCCTDANGDPSCGLPVGGTCTFNSECCTDTCTSGSCA